MKYLLSAFVVIILSLLGSVVLADSQINQEAHKKLKAQPLINISGDRAFFIVHATNPEFWDHYGERVEQVMQNHLEKNYPVVQMMLPEERSIFIQADHDFLLFPFDGSSHRISFSGRQSTWAGGNFTQCLCSGISHYLINHKEKSKTLSLNIVTDAIYEIVDVEELGLRRAGDGFLKTYFLDILIEELGKEKFITYVKEQFLGDGESSICKMTRSFHFVIYLNGELLFSFGDGSQMVELNFLKAGNM